VGAERAVPAEPPQSMLRAMLAKLRGLGP
jgi:hypothetical protein